MGSWLTLAPVQYSLMNAPHVIGKLIGGWRRLIKYQVGASYARTRFRKRALRLVGSRLGGEALRLVVSAGVAAAGSAGTV